MKELIKLFWVSLQEICYLISPKSIIILKKVPHCQINKSQNECWFLPKINGDPKKGLRQSEESFDYERFYPPENHEEKEYESADDSAFTKMSDEMNAIFSTSTNDSDQYKEFLPRSSRKTNYRQSVAHLNIIEDITDIKTMCPLDLKNEYESHGLFCTDLRNISKIL